MTSQPIPVPWGQFCLMGALAYGTLWWLGQYLARDRALSRILYGALFVRAFLGVALYLISYYHLPVLTSLQIGNGFWAFGLDSPGYHLHARSILLALTNGVELPEPGTSIEYFLIVAGVYRLFGIHPLAGVFFNAWLATLAAGLAYLLSRRLFDRRAGLAASLLFGLWPSSLVWSAQLLKDAMSWFLIVAALWLVVVMLPSREQPGRHRLARWVLGCVALSGIVMGLTRVRFYLGSVVVVTALCCLGPYALLACLRRQIRHGVAYGSILAVVTASVLFARGIDLVRLISPRHPELAHLRLGRRDLEIGDLASAHVHYSRAGQLDPQLAQAHLGLADALLGQGMVEESLTVLTMYIKYESDEIKRQRAYAILLGFQPVLPTVRKWQGKVDQDRLLLVPPALIGQLDDLVGISRTARRAAAATGPAAAATGPAAAATGPAAAATGPAAAARGSAVTETSSPFPWRHLVPMVQRISPVVTRSLSQFDEAAASTAHDLSPQVLGQFREGFVSTGGYSLIDAWAQISTPKKLLTYLPRALAIGFLAPFPWQWFDTKGSTGVMRAFASIEMTLLYALVPFVVLGVVRLLRRREASGYFLLTFIVLAAFSMSLVIANLGTLFRLRLQFLLPLLIVAGGGEPVQWLQRLRMALWPVKPIGPAPSAAKTCQPALERSR